MSEAKRSLIVSFGLNHYSTRYTTGKLLEQPSVFDAFFGGVENVFEDTEGKPIGHRGHNGHPYIVPWGFYKLLKHVEATWCRAVDGSSREDVVIIVTENGYAGQDEGELELDQIIQDSYRQDYYRGYVGSLVRAIEEGVPIRGYLAWSLLE
jgi:beta-glucosidase/6-phospho-beta-glucosidase/beta-galactosidase